MSQYPITPGERARLKADRAVALGKILIIIGFTLFCLPGMLIGGYIFFLVMKALMYH